MNSCPRCAGRREIKATERSTCDWCSGSGLVLQSNKRYTTCRVCEGRGVLVILSDQSIPCHYCTDTITFEP